MLPDGVSNPGPLTYESGALSIAPRGPATFTRIKHTLMCLSIGTPKNNKFSICSKWKIHYFQVSQNSGKCA